MPKDDFYKIAADTKLIQLGTYAKEDLNIKSVDERINKYCPKINFKTTEDYLSYFNIDNLEEDIRLRNLDLYDYLFCTVVGSIGFMISYYSNETFNKIHDKKFVKKENPVLFKIQKLLEHPGDLNDKELGFGHRPMFGHDWFNFKEIHECIVDKAEYLKQNNSSHPLLLGAFKIMKHIFLSDPMSKEGIPIPGHSMFRDKMVDLAKHNHNVYQELFTIKMSDLSCTAFITIACKIWKKHKNIGNDSYINYELDIYSNSIAILLGLLTGFSLNYPGLFKILWDSVKMSFLSNKIRKEYEEIVSDDLTELIEFSKTNFNLTISEINKIIC